MHRGGCRIMRNYVTLLEGHKGTIYVYEAEEIVHWNTKENIIA